MVPNRKLRTRREAMPSRIAPGEAMSRSELAEAVNNYLWETTRRRYALDGHTLARYERGYIRWPSAHYRAGLRAVLGVTEDHELGFQPTARGNSIKPQTPDDKPKIGDHGSLTYSASVNDSLDTLSSLVQADHSDSIQFDVINFSTSASNAAVLAWLVGTPNPDTKPSGEPVRSRDIEEIITTTEKLDKLDRQFAGKFGRNLAVTYLNKRAVPMLYRPCSDTVRRELFHSVSVLCEVIGYMAYDAQLHGIGQRYLIQSLRLAREAGNVAYGSFVLATLSHQALYVGQPNHALTLAQGAEHNYRNGPISTVTTEAAMLQATAYSSIGDRSNCERSLSQAEALFDRQRGDTLPYWASHWGDAVFASFVGECWIKLEQPRKAQPYLDLAWKESGGQVRRRVFAAGQLAKAAALEGDIERSIEYGTIALDAARIAGSKRSHRVVQEVIETLSRYSSVKTVQEFTGHVSVTLS